MADNDGIRSDWVNKDFYAELGVAKTATADDIKKAYRKLARANHPDSNPGDTAKHEKFKKVAEAYDVIGDPEKRKKYDEVRSLYAGGGFPGGFGGAGFGGRSTYGNTGGAGAGGYNFDDLFAQATAQQGGAGGGGFADMFGDLFGGGRSQRRVRPQKGADIETTATVGFVDALEGVTIQLRLTSDAPCPDCNGTGGKPGTKPHVCNVCGGQGSVIQDLGGFQVSETCPACGGRQVVYDEACPTCHGSGRGLSGRTISAKIPAGVKDGQRIRLRGKGAVGEAGGPNGDLFVVVKVTPHRVFSRSGDNLTIDVPVSFDEAALGSEVRIPTLGGSPVTLKVPAGTPNGRTFRVRGRGVKKADGTSGDLLATVEVQVPAVLSPEAREALEAYRAATGGKPLREGLFDTAASEAASA
ncbi:DnaJ C-terminal domain-containing protein [Nocardioides sp. Kera G14]|uniref:DnaJ C-terminal domain-containing protein n=1 Tax=Nocardioides sp. Kera G14 TaxID=2884264 RepID=UPI001D0FEF25|nr:DnaJ C-terminal domain-containing protein [Nocardioides sp. Kera G14]UDY23207.1 DnaJ domain-containing protein [Nocardioides sp. Kera G14]